MQKSIRVRLSSLMFLEYFIWGSWYVTMGTYLFTNFKADAIQVGSSYANLSIAAIISPFFVGLIADRFFAAQKVLGVLHLMGAITLYFISTLSDFSSFWWLILLYTLLYMPTMALSNSISFSQLKDPGKEFPSIRVFGTVGWIVAGLLIGFLGVESSVLTFRIAAGSSLLLGVFSFFLPDTPAKKNADNRLSAILGLDALVLFKNRSFAVFFISSIAICIPLSFYYSFTNSFLNDIGVSNTAGKMTLGQASEFFFMLAIPFLFRGLGVKKMLLIGIAAWIVRYLLFAYGNVGANMWMLYAGIMLHGICYDFFFVTGQIYTDAKAGPAVKNAAQGLITFATYGVGMLIGSYVSGFITESHSTTINNETSYQWQQVWLMPALIAGAVLFAFAIFFKDKLKAVEQIKN
ncbi:nucleoside permease [Pedobacter nyackensis]|uniref:Nucleoside transporter n=1 Tax=Pedobacter nyackensis TaxID=475255 RepID=A0A1W2F586_9SPHI|nr:nucleoside permease [Pedobacter nyackensis]SMD16708.1 nucleoside transporter [Pedobacter nyackensis]